MLLVVLVSFLFGVFPAFGCADALVLVAFDDRPSLSTAATSLAKELERTRFPAVRGVRHDGGQLMVHTETAEAAMAITTRYWRAGFEGHPVLGIVNIGPLDPPADGGVLSGVPGPAPLAVDDESWAIFLTPKGRILYDAGRPIPRSEWRDIIPADKIDPNLRALFALDHRRRGGWQPDREVLIVINEADWEWLNIEWSKMPDVVVNRVHRPEANGDAPQLFLIGRFATPEALFRAVKDPAVRLAGVPEGMSTKNISPQRLTYK